MPTPTPAPTKPPTPAPRARGGLSIDLSDFDKLVPPGKSASSSSSGLSLDLSDFDKLVPKKPGAPQAGEQAAQEEAPTVAGELKALGRNLTSVEGLKKIGSGLYHGIVDPAATVAEYALDDPRTIAREAQHEKELTDAGAPGVAHDTKGILSAAAQTAVAAIPVGELAGEGLAKIAPGAVEKVAAAAKASRAVRLGLKAAGGAAHGAAFGAAASPDHPGVGAALGALGGAVLDPAADLAGEAAGKVREGVVNRLKAAKIVPPESLGDVAGIVKDPHAYVLGKRDAAVDAVRDFDRQQAAAEAARQAANAPTVEQQRALPATTDHGADYEVETNPMPVAPTPAPPTPANVEADGLTHIDDRIRKALATDPEAASQYEALQQQRRELEEQRDLARRQAEVDAMTGLGNQGAYQRALPTAEQDPATSVVRFDLNGMKGVNDALGHAEGDAAIQRAAAALAQAAATVGVPARLFRVGGDELAALVPQQQADALRTAAEEHYGLVEHAPGVRSSISGGIGNTDAEADADSYQRKALHKAAQGIPERGARPAVDLTDVAEQLNRVISRHIVANSDRINIKTGQNLGPDEATRRANDEERDRAGRALVEPLSDAQLEELVRMNIEQRERMDRGLPPLDNFSNSAPDFAAQELNRRAAAKREPTAVAKPEPTAVAKPPRVNWDPKAWRATYGSRLAQLSDQELEHALAQLEANHAAHSPSSTGYELTQRDILNVKNELANRRAWQERNGGFAPQTRYEQDLMKAPRAEVEAELARHEELLDVGLSAEDTRVAKRVVMLAKHRLEQLDAEAAAPKKALPEPTPEPEAPTAKPERELHPEADELADLASTLDPATFAKELEQRGPITWRAKRQLEQLEGAHNRMMWELEQKGVDIDQEERDYHTNLARAADHPSLEMDSPETTRTLVTHKGAKVHVDHAEGQVFGWEMSGALPFRGVGFPLERADYKTAGEMRIMLQHRVRDAMEEANWQRKSDGKTFTPFTGADATALVDKIMAVVEGKAAPAEPKSKKGAKVKKAAAAAPAAPDLLALQAEHEQLYDDHKRKRRELASLKNEGGSRAKKQRAIVDAQGELAAIEKRLDALRAELAQHGIERVDWREREKKKAPRGASADDLTKKPTKPEEELHPTARTESGAWRPYHTVQRDALIDEMAALRDRIAERGMQTQLQPRETDDGSMITVATGRKGRGVSTQAQATQNIRDWQRKIEEIQQHLVATRGMTLEEVDERENAALMARYEAAEAAKRGDAQRVHVDEEDDGESLPYEVGPVYHGTLRNFPAPALRIARGDIGIHFGTEGQARERIGDKRRFGEGPFENDGRTIQATLGIDNPLRLPDVGEWTLSHEVYDTIMNDTTGNVPQQLKDVLEQRHEANGGHLTNTQIREIIERQGYDGIVYRNEAEVSGLREATRVYDQAVRDMYRLRREGDEAAVEAFRPHFDEAYRRLQEVKTHEEDSYIAFHARQVQNAVGEVGPRYGLHGPVEPLHNSYLVPEWRRRALPGAPLERTVATTNYPNPGGEPVRVYTGTSVAHGDFDPARSDHGGLFGAPPSGRYTTDNPRVAGGEVQTHRIGYGPFRSREEAVAQLQKLEADAATRGTRDAVFVHKLEQREDGRYEITTHAEAVTKRGYAHKGVPEEKWLYDRIRETEDELARWMKESTPLWQKFKELDAEGAFTPEERAEELEHLRHMLIATQDELRALHKKLEHVELTAAPNVHVARLAVEHPFDIDRNLDEDPMHGEEAIGRILDAARELYPGYDWDFAQDRIEERAAQANLHGEFLYRILETARDENHARLGASRVNEILEHAGYDAITHIGGGRTGGEEHRVWIPFRREQILSAFGDPRDAYMVGERTPLYAGAREPGVLGAHYRTQLAERAKRLPKADADQYELTFGSAEQGLAVADRIAAQAGNFATVTYEKPTPENLASGARARGVAAALAERAAAVTHASVSIIGQTVSSHEDIARLMRPFRDPTAEHLLFLLTDDAGKVLDFMHLTSGAINYVQPDRDMLSRLYERAQAVGATRMRPVHNHPSGDVDPSLEPGDVSFTRDVRDLLDKYTRANALPQLTVDDHVVIDHDRYAVIQLGAGRAYGIKYAKIPGIGPEGDWTAAPDLWTADDPLRITNPSDIARLTAGVVHDGRGFHALYLDTQMRAIAATPHTFLESTTLHDWLPRQIEAHAARKVAFVTRDPITATQLKAELRDAYWTQREADAKQDEAEAARHSPLEKVVDVVYLDPSGTYTSALDRNALLTPRDTDRARDAVQLREPGPQLGMFGDDPAPAPSKKDQLSMFGEHDGTKLAQDEAKKLANKDEKISPEELAQRRDELGAPKPPEIKTGEDQGALFERGPSYDHTTGRHELELEHDPNDASLPAVRQRALATIDAARASGEPLVVITPCGSQKLDRAAPARQLYTGSYAQGAVKLADAIAASGVTVEHYILSAKHGLVPADQVLAPYDTKMGEYPVTYSIERVQRQAAKFGLEGKRTIVVGGERYAEVARRALPSATVATPEGLGIGQQLRYMKQLGESMPGGEQLRLLERGPQYGAEDERVHQAAVRFRGQTFEGQTHWEAAEAARDHFGLDDTDDVYETLTDKDEGFTTTRGRYVDRVEANRLAGGADDEELRSEHLDPLFERGPSYDASGRAQHTTPGAPGAPPQGRKPKPPAPTPRAYTPAPSTRSGPADYLFELRDSFRRAFDPLARHDFAAEAGRIMRKHSGQMWREIETATEATKEARKWFQKMPRAEQLEFIDRMEQGKPQPTPELQAAADALRTALDTARKLVQSLGTGKLESWIENYFPHIWKDPTKAAIFFGKRPMEGSKSFLKQRSIPLTKDGIAAGLEPVSYNPVDLALLKLREMHRYIFAWRNLNELREVGLSRWISVRRMPPKGWTMIDDRVATKYGPPTVTVSHFESFDQQIRDTLDGVFKALGIDHRRTVTDPHAGAGTLGYAHMKGPLGGKDMWTRFGGDVGTMIHELGHLLDARYGLWDHLISKPKKRTTSGGKQVSADTPAEIADRKLVNRELRDLADARRRGQVSKSDQKYIRNRQEKIANAIEAVLYAPQLAERVAPTVMGRLRSFIAAKPELAPLLKLERGVLRGTDARVKDYDTGGLVVLAKLYAPEPVARVVNNYLSPGLRGSPWYNLYMGAGNLLNAAQLGLSAFHLGFTSLDASISKASLGLEQLLAGHFTGAAKSAALVPVAPLTNYLRGSKVLREYLRPGTQGAAFFDLADAVAKAGGRVKMDEWYKVGQLELLKDAAARAVHGAGWKERGGAAAEVWLRALPAALELAAKPLMEHIVPRQKLGVFADLAQFELERLARQYPNGAPLEAVEAALQRAWDSVDNRMGQMVYDNLFWNKIGKDLAHAAMRSVGWNVGTVRELGGGVTDTGRAAAELGRRARGRGQQPGPTDAPLFTHRMAYLFTAPVVVGLYGALLQYLYTGEGPRELKDLFYPRTGRTTPEGDEERVTLPSYMKDVGAFARHPAETVLHKASPLIALIGEMLENKDYYGTEITNPDDPGWKRAEQALAYLGKAFEPFSLEGALEARKRGGSMTTRALAGVGITPAPKEVTRSAAQEAAAEIAQRRAQGVATPEEHDRSSGMHDLVRREREGERVAPELRDMVGSGELSVADARRILKAGITTSELKRFQSLSLEQMRTVLDKATPEERAAWGPLIARKIRSAAQRHAIPRGFERP